MIKEEKKEITIKEWLNTPCLPEEVKVDEETGWKYLGIETTRAKIKYMEEIFSVQVGYQNLSHFVFTTPDRNVFASGSLNMKLVFADGSTKLLIGAATFHLQEYYPNQHYAATLKSLCICNALLEYNQFGAALNKELVSTKEKLTPESKERQEFRQQVAKCKTVVELSHFNKKGKGMRDIYLQRLKQLQNDSIK